MNELDLNSIMSKTSYFYKAIEEENKQLKAENEEYKQKLEKIKERCTGINDLLNGVTDSDYNLGRITTAQQILQIIEE